MNGNPVPLTPDERLRKLAYAGTPRGCEHDWQCKGEGYRLPRWQCSKCPEGRNDVWDNLPRVGNGRIMDLGEMVRLANVLSLTVEKKENVYEATAQVAVDVDTGKTGVWSTSRYGIRSASEPEPAACSAILAAVSERP